MVSQQRLTFSGATRLRTERGPTRARTVGGPSHPLDWKRHEADVFACPGWALDRRALVTAGNNLISSWRRAASCVAFLCPLSGYANKEARGHRGSSPLSGPFFSGVGLARSALLYSYCELTRYRINKVTSSAGSARNQMKRVGLFARYGIIGLAVDDVPGVRA